MTFPSVAYWQPNFAPARLGSLMNVLAQYPNGVLIGLVSVPPAKYNEPAKVRGFIDRLLENAKAIPSARFAGMSHSLLGGNQNAFTIEGRPDQPPGQMPATDVARDALAASVAVLP